MPLVRQVLHVTRWVTASSEELQVYKAECCHATLAYFDTGRNDDEEEEAAEQKVASNLKCADGGLSLPDTFSRCLKALGKWRPELIG